MGHFSPARRLVAGTVLTSALLIADDAVAATQSDVLKRFREQAPRLIEKHRGEIQARTDGMRARYRKERAQAERIRTARRAGRTTVARGDLAAAPRRIEQKGFHDGDTGAVVPLPLNPFLDPLGILDDESGESPPVGPLHRIAFYDFDADGDIDVFVGDKYGYIRYFENVGSVTEPDFEERFDGDNPFDGIDFSDPSNTGPSDAPAPFLANVDGDAAPEAYVGTYDGDVLFFQLNGSGDFVQDDANNLVQPVLAAFESGAGQDVTYTVPHLVDIDGDNDLDVFLGTKEHGVLFFRREGAVYVDRTADASNPLLGISFFEHTAPFFADIDGDGDLDAFVGDNKNYSGPIELGFVRYFENEAGVFQERFEPGEHPLVGNLFTFGQPAFADLDGDGDLDAFVGGKPFVTMSFKNTGTAQSPAFLTTANGIEFFDYDGDGDLDAFVDLGKFGGVGYFENTGTAEEPQWTVRTGEDNPFDDFNTYISEYFGGELQYLPLGARPVVGNIDADPELEAFVGVALAGCKCDRGAGAAALVPSRGIIPSDEILGLLFYLERDGNGQFQVVDAPLPAPFFNEQGPPPAFFDSLPDPHLADIDGDNDLDLVVGSKIRGELPPGNTGLSEDDRGVVFFFQNDGGTFTLVNTLGDDSPAEDAIGELGLVSAFMADVDGDGDLDLFVGGAKYATETAPENYTVAFLFLNDGGFDPTARIPVETFTGFLPTPALADVNGDGHLDFFLGGKFSAQHFLTPEQQGVAPVAAPTLSQWMLGALSGLLGLVGLSVLRRRLT